MRLIERIERDGAALFRWRSLVPLVLVPLWLVAANDGAHWDKLVGQRGEDIVTLLAFLVSLAGLAIRWVTVGFVPGGTSGRNTLEQRATYLNTTGMYSIVRNPLYLGNFVALLGVALATKAWWFPIDFCLAYWLYIERVIASEEKFLLAEFGDDYERWAAATPVFLPRLKLWRAPALTFSLRTVLRREYNGLLAVASIFLVYELWTDVVIEREGVRQWLGTDWLWPAIFIFSAISFIALRTLKRHTKILRVDGR